MSTTPQLSPLEQLGQTVQQQSTSAPSQPSSNTLSPLEQLGQTVQKQPGTSPNSTWETPSDISTGGEGSNSDQQLMSEDSQRDATKKGLIIGGAGAAAVGGLAAPALVAGATPALVDAAGEPIIQATKTLLQKFGENYPELSKLASKLGFQAGATGSTVAAWELLKHITGSKK